MSVQTSPPASERVIEAMRLLHGAVDFRENFIPQILRMIGCKCRQPGQFSGYICGPHVWAADTEAIIKMLTDLASTLMNESPVELQSRITTRQSARRQMCEHYCTALNLNLETVCYQRFQRTYDQLTEQQTKLVLDSLAQAHVHKTGGKRR